MSKCKPIHPYTASGFQSAGQGDRKAATTAQWEGSRTEQKSRVDSPVPRECLSYTPSSAQWNLRVSGPGCLYGTGYREGMCITLSRGGMQGGVACGASLRPLLLVANVKGFRACTTFSSFDWVIALNKCSCPCVAAEYHYLVFHSLSKQESYFGFLCFSIC